jgi:hypothetical protein
MAKQQSKSARADSSAGTGAVSASRATDAGTATQPNDLVAAVEAAFGPKPPVVEAAAVAVAADVRAALLAQVQAMYGHAVNLTAAVEAFARTAAQEWQSRRQRGVFAARHRAWRVSQRARERLFFRGGW